MVMFETEKEFVDAVMAVLYDRLDVSVYVGMERSDDYYSNEQVPKVEVCLLDRADHNCIASADGKA